MEHNNLINFKKKHDFISNSEFNTFFGLNLTLLDLEQDPDALIKTLAKMKIIHSRENGGCGTRINFKFEKKHYRLWCNCGMLLIFPPRADRDNALLAKWFPKKEFKEK